MESDSNMNKGEMTPENRKVENFYGIGRSIILAFFLVLSIIFAVYVYEKKSPMSLNTQDNKLSVSNNSETGMVKFGSKEDFSEYLKATNLNVGTINSDTNLLNIVPEKESGASGGSEICDNEIYKSASWLNSQILRDIQPDVLKVKDKRIFLRNSEETDNDSIGIIDTSSPQAIKIIGLINESGNFLLSKNILVVFSGNNLLGYDIKNGKNPRNIWGFKMNKEDEILANRLYDNKIYIIVKSQVNSTDPCPLSLSKTQGINIDCTEIYHPANYIPVDSVFTIFTLDLSGNLINKISFVGTSEFSSVYMTNNNIYLTYVYYSDLISFLSDFFDKDGLDIVSNEVRVKIKNLKNEDKSLQIKTDEFQSILEDYTRGLSQDAVLKLRTDLSEKLDIYSRKHIRDLERSGIVKISINDLDILARGDIPGRPLNKFSLNENNDLLRIVTKVGQGFSVGSLSSSDVYVLDDGLNVLGSILGFGSGNNICSVVFGEDKAYALPSKTHLSFVLDLSDLKSPKRGGELNFSSLPYLYPINNDLVLGIMSEGKTTKISLFDLNDANSPKEVSGYSLDESWREVESRLNAFLLNKDHKIFFLSAQNNAYFFSYKDNVIGLSKKINMNIERVIYADNRFYLISKEGVFILDPVNLDEVKE